MGLQTGEYMDQATRNKIIRDQISTEVSLWKEYRTRLIADVVTGKLDVREVVAQMPDEVEELESLNEIDDSAEIEDLDAVAE